MATTLLASHLAGAIHVYARSDDGALRQVAQLAAESYDDPARLAHLIGDLGNELHWFGNGTGPAIAEAAPAAVVEAPAPAVEAPRRERRPIKGDHAWREDKRALTAEAARLYADAHGITGTERKLLLKHFQNQRDRVRKQRERERAATGSRLPLTDGRRKPRGTQAQQEARRQRVVDIIAASPTPMDTQTIADALGEPRLQVKGLLDTLFSNRRVQRTIDLDTGAYVYYVPTPPTPEPGPDPEPETPPTPEPQPQLPSYQQVIADYGTPPPLSEPIET